MKSGLKQTVSEWFGISISQDPIETFTIDDSLSPLQVIKKYIKSNILLHRLYVVRSLSTLIKEIKFEVVVKEVIPIMRELLHEPDANIRESLIEQIPPITQYFLSLKGENFEKYGELVLDQLLHVFVPMVSELTTDPNQQVRLLATDVFLELATYVEKENIEFYFLPIVKSLAKDTTEEEHRLQAAHMLAKLSPLLGSTSSAESIVPVFCSLANDSGFRIRKAVALGLGKICKTVGSIITKKQLIPTYIKLSTDSLWGIRKSCVESIVDISQSLNLEDRPDSILPIFHKFLHDDSKWVKGIALQKLGPLITTLKSEMVKRDLIDPFNSMVFDKQLQSEIHGEHDLSWYAAFYFPGVIYTIGKDRWKEVSTAYFTLVKENTLRTRKTLSCSLHAIARILGPTITEEELLPVFDLFNKDSDEMRMGFIQNITYFLEVLRPPIRSKYLPLINSLRENSNWRIRKLIAKQLSNLVKLFTIEEVNNTVVTILLHLLQDTFFTVRKTSCKHVGTLLNRLTEENSTLKQEVERQIITLGTHAIFQKRQLFILICQYLRNQIPRNIFREKYLPKLLSLATDKVANVRLSLAKLLRQFLQDKEFCDDEKVKLALEKLKIDKDRDVKYFASNDSYIPKVKLDLAFQNNEASLNNNDANSLNNQNLYNNINNNNNNTNLEETVFIQTNNNNNEATSSANKLLTPTKDVSKEEVFPSQKKE